MAASAICHGICRTEVRITVLSLRQFRYHVELKHPTHSRQTITGLVDFVLFGERNIDDHLLLLHVPRLPNTSLLPIRQLHLHPKAKVGSHT